MRKLLLLSACLFCLAAARPQGFEIGASAGLGTYSMKDLRKINENAMAALPFEAKVTDNFPPWVQYRITAIYHWKGRYNFGLIYMHNSTGSRVSSKDYSGEYSFDNLLRSNAAGAVAGMTLGRIRHARIDFNLNLGAVFTRFENHESLTVADTTISNNYTSNSVSFFGNPELAFTYSFPAISIGAFFGYLADSGSNATYSNWSGIRLGLTASVNLPLRKKQQDNTGEK